MPAEFETIRYETRGPVAVITYDRQERRNAWTVPMYREIVAAIGEANANDAIGAIVITNAGPVFCSGVDFKAPPEPRDPVTGKVVNIATLSMAQDESWLHLLAASKPVIAAVAGAAIGAGATQILAADIRMGSASSTYAFPFLKLGVMPEIGCTGLLPRLVGLGRALDICLTARTLDAAEALAIGLITRVCSDKDLLDEAIALAAQMAGYPALQMKLTKGLLRDNAAEADANAILRRETQAFVTMFKARKAALSHLQSSPE
ncbi:MAG: enoyl-CoA hydratase/carnithine racemase [Caulobacter sp.]|nr:enoyl-CoA hydratase/carnithine racemase [Caulobacter sp.]